jgi:DNA-3-methyladenine glycosylase II
MTQIRDMNDIRKGLSMLARRDAQLKAILPAVGEVPLRLAQPGFAGLAAIVISQQVSKASADAIYSRLVSLVVPLEPAGILAADEEIFRSAGLSRPKQRTLVHVADAIVSGTLDLDHVCTLDPQEAIDAMTAVKGIGPWTAEIYLMFCAGHADIFPAGDLALQEAARAAYGLENRPDDKQLRAIAAAWTPWRSVAARLLWSYYRTLKQGREAMPL